MPERRTFNWNRSAGWCAVCLIVTLLSSISPAEAKRVALVAGNSKYEHVKSLANARRDAATIADRLRDLGFEVAEIFDGDSFALNRAAERFLQDAEGAELALFYFAGHGIQLFDKNFLLARDVNADIAKAPDDLGIDLAEFLAKLKKADTVRSVLMIDACRNNPFSFEETVSIIEGFRDSGSLRGETPSVDAQNRGLARMVLSGGETSAGKGETMLFFAAQPGAVSYDGSGQNSFFVEGIKEALTQPDRPLSEIFRQASAYVRTVTQGEQIPQMVSDWTRDITLGAQEAANVAYAVDEQLAAEDRALAIRSVSNFTKLSGDFIVKASLGPSEDYDLTPEEQQRLKQIHGPTGYSITYDIDRDGREETIRVYFQMANFVFTVEDEDVRASFANCSDGQQVSRMEIALKDVNGDRRPEVWLLYETEDALGWGKFCILEYKGVAHLDSRRRANTGLFNGGYAMFRTLLRGESGWNVTVANDNSIKACGGTGCHTFWSYRFDNGKFHLLNQPEGIPQGAADIPFSDERERAAILFRDYRNKTQPLPANGWQVARSDKYTVAAKTIIGERTEVAIECKRPEGDGAWIGQSVVVRDSPASGASGAAEFELQESLAYGENADIAPILVDNGACLAHYITTQDDGSIDAVTGNAIRMSWPEEHAESCINKISHGSKLTLPVLFRQNQLIQIALGNAGPAIDAARAACREGGLPQAADITIEERIVAFITDRYLNSAAIGNDASDIYAATVDYYDKQQMRKNEILRDVSNYYKRWPQRSYKLHRDTLRLEQDGQRPDVFNVSFEYDFEVSGATGTRSGRGVTRLSLAASGNSFRIMAVSGKVLARN